VELHTDGYGNYGVSMWWTAWSSRSTAVPVDIKHSGGTARVTINQQLNGGKWNSLGSYSLVAGVSYTVTITSQPGPSSTCADAVKFAYLGGGGGANEPPLARNDSGTTSTGTPVSINVVANDTDDVGVVAASVAIVTSPSNGTAVPNGSGSVTYTPSAAFTGTTRHVHGGGQPGRGVERGDGDRDGERGLRGGGDRQRGSGDVVYRGWDVSGASGSYGTNSVWSRDGSKYTWNFTPSVSGNYDVSMWWTVWPSRSTAVPVDVKHSGGTARVTINQQLNGGSGTAWGVIPWSRG